jgi:hypothetical protein
MGLTSWTGAEPRKADASVAKNYLGAEELDALNKIVTAYLEFAEVQALNRRPMYMADWIAKLDDFLKLSEEAASERAEEIVSLRPVCRGPILGLRCPNAITSDGMAVGGVGNQLRRVGGEPGLRLARG